MQPDLEFFANLGLGVRVFAFSQEVPVFRLQVPKTVAGVPNEVLFPETAWRDGKALQAQITKLARLFVENFKQYYDKATPEVINAGPLFPSV